MQPTTINPFQPNYSMIFSFFCSFVISFFLSFFSFTFLLCIIFINCLLFLASAPRHPTITNNNKPIVNPFASANPFTPSEQQQQQSSSYLQPPQHPQQPQHQPSYLQPPVTQPSPQQQQQPQPNAQINPYSSQPVLHQSQVNSSSSPVIPLQKTPSNSHLSPRQNSFLGIS